MSQSYLRDLNYKIQMEQMLLNQWGIEKPREASRKFELPTVEDLLNVSSKKESQNKALLRQQQIQAYLEKEKRPVIVNGQEYKFNRIAEPQLEDLKPINDTIVALEDDLVDIEKDINKTLQNIKIEQENITKLNKEIAKLIRDKSLREYRQQENINEVTKLDKLKKDITNKADEEKNKLKAERKSIPKDQREQKVDYQTKVDKIDDQTTKELEKIDAQIQILNDENKALESEKQQLEQDIKDLKNEISQKTKDIANFENDLLSLQANLDVKKDDLNATIQDLKEKQKENSIKIRDYSEELRRLNFGSFNVDRLPMESEEDYLKRLTDNALLPFDDSTTKTLSDIERNETFRNNLKLLFQSDSYIEQILNYLKMVNGEAIFVFNTYFNLFKDDYLKVYGYNNKALLDDPDQFIDLITRFTEQDNNNQPSLVTPLQDYEQKRIGSILQPITQKIEELKTDNLLTDLSYEEMVDELNRQKALPNADQQQIRQLETSVKQLSGTMKKLADFTPEKLNNGTVMKFTSPTTRQVVYLKYIIIEPTTIRLKKSNGIVKQLMKKPPIILTSNSGAVGSWEEKSNNDFVKFLESYFDLTNDEIINLLEVKNNKLHNLSGNLIMNFFTKNGLGLSETIKEDSQRKNLKLLKDNSSLIGMGITNNLQEYVKFGKYTLLLKKLVLKNILSLQKNNGLKIAGFKNYKVSDEFVNLIMKILKKESLSPHDISILKIGEREILDHLLSVAELNKTILTGSGAETLNKIKDQLKLIEGQIEAGNNNELLKDELYKTLFKLVHHGAITEMQARKHYKQIINDFF